MNDLYKCTIHGAIDSSLCSLRDDETVDIIYLRPFSTTRVLPHRADILRSLCRNARDSPFQSTWRKALCRPAATRGLGMKGNTLNDGRYLH